jgi:hypothetical protein
LLLYQVATPTGSVEIVLTILGSHESGLPPKVIIPVNIGNQRSSQTQKGTARGEAWEDEEDEAFLLYHCA